MYLIINNLEIFRKKIELISEINFLNASINELKKKIIDYLLDEKFFEKKIIESNDFEEKYRDAINLINNNAPIKVIYKNKNEEEIIEIFHEITKEIKKIELNEKIQSLEDRVSINLDETLY